MASTCGNNHPANDSDSIIHRLGHVSQLAAAPADLLHVLVEACVGVCFLLLFQLAQTALSFSHCFKDDVREIIK